MSSSTRIFASRKRLHTPVKVVALLAALGFVTVMLEQPRLTASPSYPRTSLEQRAGHADSGDVRLTGATSVLEQRMYATDSGDAPLNSRLAPAVREAESQPPTF